MWEPTGARFSPDDAWVLFDIAAPSLVTWGYCDGAIEAVRAWLEGRAQASAKSPVNLSPRPA
jgi:beta-N-acetylhexosaminidase